MDQEELVPLTLGHEELLPLTLLFRLYIVAELSDRFTHEETAHD